MMKIQEFDLKLPTDYSLNLLKNILNKKVKSKKYVYEIVKKSLDARNKKNIHWLLKVRIYPKGNLPPESNLRISLCNRRKRVIVVGSGPAGFFSAYILQQAGFSVKIIELGSDVDKRNKDITDFESLNKFNPASNYAFGEGGAGTFSDGKLTSRTKTIKEERKYIFSEYIKAGAPEEIAYLAHPHVGSDNLKRVVKNLRRNFQKIEGEISFSEKMIDIEVNSKTGKVSKLITDKAEYSADYFIMAIGHSSLETYKMLISKGVLFRSKPFAIGCRVEHAQKVINIAQWGCEELKGVKAAEYRLTYKSDADLPVYSFCMCPGGKVVNASFDLESNIVNGMSNYQRNSPYANAAIVAGIDLRKQVSENISALESLNWLNTLEKKFWEISENHNAPFVAINDFLQDKVSTKIPESSYDFELFPYTFNQIFPEKVCDSLKKGLHDFSQKLKGFDLGIMLGFESKVSSPIQVLRTQNGRCETIQNLYMIGEGSGYAGGIISSGADGIKAALEIMGSC